MLAEQGTCFQSFKSRCVFCEFFFNTTQEEIDLHKRRKNPIFKVETSTVIGLLPETICLQFSNLCFLQAARETCRKFLCEENGERVIIVTDPPFGGLVEALASSFKKLMAMWRETEKEGRY